MENGSRVVAGPPQDDVPASGGKPGAARPWGRSDGAAATLPPPRLVLVGLPRLVRDRSRDRTLARKDAALLAMLALDGPMSRARAAAMLWPDTGHPAGNLRQRLFRLRRTADFELVVGGAILRLAESLVLDLHTLPQAIAADATAGSGELLEGLDYADHEPLATWVAAARSRWCALRRERLAERASALEAAGRIAAALSFAQRLVADDPLCEHAHRRLMRLHYRRGDRAAALAAHLACTRALRAELDVAPCAETEALRQLIARGAVLPAPAAAAAPHRTS